VAIALRLTYLQLKARCKKKYGLYMSSKMVTAFHAYRDFLLTKESGTATTHQIAQAETALINAWLIWSNTKEFRKTDGKTNGLLTALGVEMNALPNVDRESNTTAFVLHGEERVNPTRKKPPRVEVTDQLVPAYLEGLHEKGETYAVVMIDAFGGGDSQQAHGFNRKYGTQASTVLENIQAVLETAKEHDAPIVNVTMKEDKTWKCFTDHFSSKVVNVVKPAQPLFMGNEDYFTATVKKVRDTGATTFVVVGWDANQCVAAAIFGVEPSNRPFVPGLVDFGWNVVTSRNLLGANAVGELESQWGWPHIGPSAPRAIGLTHDTL
jgi:hypothetical protein